MTTAKDDQTSGPGLMQVDDQQVWQKEEPERGKSQITQTRQKRGRAQQIKVYGENTERAKENTQLLAGPWYIKQAREVQWNAIMLDYEKSNRVFSGFAPYKDL